MAKQGTTRKEEFTVLGDVKYVDGKKKLVLKSPGHFQVCLNRVKEGHVAVSVSTKTPTRSKQQLNLFMVLCEYIADHTGYTKNEIYPLMIEDVWPPKTITLNGRERKVRKSVSDVAKMPKSDMWELITHTQEVCDELGIYVPSAEELGYFTG